MSEIRIGVFICHCGTNIGGFLDISAIAEYAKTLPNVVFVQTNLYTCSEVGLTEIRKNVKEQNLNRVIVASCSPRTHEPLFRATCNEAGLNPYLFEMVNIRDQCSWVHMKDRGKATEKAKDLIKMGVSKAALIQPLEKIRVKINPSALIIGGGVAGMTSALNLANQGFTVFLVEKEPELGGLVKNLNVIYPDNEQASKYLQNLIQKVKENLKIKTYTGSTIAKVEGFIGNYKVVIKSAKESFDVEAGIIIVATGASTFSPKGLFGYNGKIVITQLELEQLLKKGNVLAQNIVMIQCVGVRNEERNYCSNICCMSAIKNATLFKGQNSSANIMILFRDIQAQGTLYEEYYRNAREKGILFLKYLPEKAPVVKEKTVEVYNDFLNQELSIPFDLVVLSTPLIANDDAVELAKMLKVPVQENNFFLEAHVKLRPVDFATDGIYMCGSAHWPADISESVSQACAAASRASIIISKTYLEVEGSTAEINNDLCVGCEVCVKLCPYKAISRNEEDLITVNKVLCKSCGVCGASCPHNAIIIHHFTSDQLVSEIISYGGC